MKKAIIALIIIVVILLLVWWLMPETTTAPDLEEQESTQTAESDENFEGLSDEELEAEFEALDADIESL